MQPGQNGQSEAPWVGTIEHFQALRSNEYREAIDSIWNVAGKKLNDTIANLVEEGVLTPVQGLGLVSSTAAQLTAYGAFHGQPTPMEAVSAIRGAQQQRVTEPAPV